MRNIWTIAKREYRAYFSSLTAYLFAFLILAVIGGFFALTIWITFDSFGQLPPPGVDLVLYPLIFLLIFACPAFTMRLLSEEQRLGTLELLMTAPVRDAELVVGKWLGSFLFVATLVGITLVYPIAMHMMTSPGIDQGPMVTGYLGILLISASFLAMGVAVSGLFSNQIASYVLTVALIVLMWWVIGIFSQAGEPGTTTATIFKFLDMKSHYYDAMVTGVLPLSGVVYYLSLTAFGLLFGSVIVETRRWR
jgi:ABC-2 type transport system permease protein